MTRAPGPRGCLLVCLGVYLAAAAMLANDPCDLRILGPVPVFAEHGRSISLNCTMKCPAASKGWETSLRKSERRHDLFWTWTSVVVGEWITYPKCYAIYPGGHSITNTTIVAYEPPDYVSIDLSKVMEVGRAYNITCGVRNIAPKKYLTLLIRRGNDILYTESYNSPITGNGPVTMTRSITAQREDHRAEYTCLARLDLRPNAGVFEKSSSIHVRAFDLPLDPTIHALGYIELGADATAICEVARAVPLTDAKADLLLDATTLSGTTLINGDTLITEAIVPTDMPGNHTLECRVTTDLDVVTRRVEQFIYVHSFPEPVLNVKEANTLVGVDVNITCTLPETDPSEALITIKGSTTLKTCEGSSEITCNSILKAQKEDNAMNIECEARLRSLNITKSTFLTLNVTYGPEFSLSLCPITRTWLEGATATFSCKADGNPGPYVQCTKDGGANVIGDWPGIMKNQSGVYQCLARNYYGSSNWNVTVDVEYEPKFIDSLCLGSLAWLEGTRATFSCEADGNPTPHIECAKDGGPNAIGHWPNITRQDSGTYLCKASNKHGTSVKNVEVTVEYLPEFTDQLCPSSLTLLEGVQDAPAEFFCKADGKPAPLVECIKDGDMNGFGQWPNITRGDSGFYRCNANNPHGVAVKNITVAIEYGPKFNSSLCPSPLTWIEGTPVTFSCRANGNPIARVECSKDGGQNAIGDWKKIGRNESGTYRCIATNRHGSDVKDVRATVESKPTVLHIEIKPSTSIYHKQSVTLRCQADGLPAPTYQWRTPYHSSLSYSVDNSTVTISETEFHHSGLYECEVSNKHGRDAQRVEIHVKDTLPILLGAIMGAAALAAVAGISAKMYLLHRAQISQKYQLSKAQEPPNAENPTNSYVKMPQFEICDA
ncbi:intercellular adhesion molecule 5-like isoform X3 [Ambystoma mexicanum]|uniref:intercellular adhesion molecule 5-like isoform X3 n=1 Tax=Ambystoma mexicanum TaxID=8296 RepID=UPI0037E7B840